MKNLIILFLSIVFASSAYADRTELDNGTYVDEYGNIYENKYENTDIFAPWNDRFSDEQDTNMYLRENDVKESDYYWK